MDLPQACLFDLDGLLIDTEPLHGEAWSKAASIFGAKLSEDQLMKLRGRRRIDCVKQILKWIENPIDIDEFLEVQQPIAKKLLCNAKAMPGAEELVQWCYQNNLAMALVSSSNSESVEFKSKPHQWLSLIETRVLGDDKDLLKGKPEPAPYLLAAKKLNVNPKSCWALEDSKSGTEAAFSAGCQVWVLTNKKQNNKIKSSNPIFINDLNYVRKELEEALINKAY